eukprot:GHVU01199523.1.p1 GENE.GHVU01199523.1~~GHVU01199523.1.p1  ORF type:complete len:222 (+),score=42.59 GHVU01199523.1:1561-2226(+)
MLNGPRWTQEFKEFGREHVGPLDDQIAQMNSEIQKTVENVELGKEKVKPLNVDQTLKAFRDLNLQVEAYSDPVTTHDTDAKILKGSDAAAREFATLMNENNTIVVGGVADTNDTLEAEEDAMQEIPKTMDFALTDQARDPEEGIPAMSGVLPIGGEQSEEQEFEDIDKRKRDFLLTNKAGAAYTSLRTLADLYDVPTHFIADVLCRRGAEPPIDVDKDMHV